jgi:hypothetical protein
MPSLYLILWFHSPLCFPYVVSYKPCRVLNKFWHISPIQIIIIIKFQFVCKHVTSGKCILNILRNWCLSTPFQYNSLYKNLFVGFINVLLKIKINLSDTQTWREETPVTLVYFLFLRNEIHIYIFPPLFSWFLLVMKLQFVL